MMALRRDAIIIGAGGGIGSAFADNIGKSGEFSETVRLSRHKSADFYADISDVNSIEQAASAIKAAGLRPALVICATGILHDETRQPEKSLRELDTDWLMQVYKVNTIGPAIAAKHFLPLMPRKEKAVFAALGARVGSISDNGLGGWYGYRASKAALHMMIRNIAIEWARKNPLSIATALHPGTVDTELSTPFQRSVPDGRLFSPEYSAQKMLQVLGGLRPEQTGRIFAWDGQEIAP